VKFLLIACGIFFSSFPVEATGISVKAGKNFAAIDALDVEHRWPAGVHVDWKSGIPDHIPEKSDGKHTHCSAFAAAAADTLGIYLLHPPEHGQIFLANAQADWLASAAARDRGWLPVPDGFAAQAAANDGDFVVAIYKNPRAKKPGHIAVIRPSLRTGAELNREGPEVTQAGLHNHLDTTLAAGFADHRRALRDHLIRFYRHEVGQKDARN